jgi:hypothetical protein
MKTLPKKMEEISHGKDKFTPKMGKIIPNFEKIKIQKQKLFKLLLIFSTGKPGLCTRL